MINNYLRRRFEKRIIDNFVNEGERCLIISAKSILSGSEHLDGYDVVFVRRLSETVSIGKSTALLNGYALVVDTALRLADKRVIIGVDESVKEPFLLYLARVKYHWENYAFEGDDIDYYIIDKNEDQTLASLIR